MGGFFVTSGQETESSTDTVNRQGTLLLKTLAINLNEAFSTFTVTNISASAVVSAHSALISKSTPTSVVIKVTHRARARAGVTSDVATVRVGRTLDTSAIEGNKWRKTGTKRVLSAFRLEATAGSGINGNT